MDDPLLTKNAGWKWNGSSWYICFNSNWAQSFSHSMINLTQFSSAPPCGSGYYAENSFGFVWHNNQWYGGEIYPWFYLTEYYHYLPA